MSRSKVKTNWPEAFTIFPSDNDEAAQAWFKEPRNLVFTTWMTCLAEKADHWKDLELTVQTITGQRNLIVCRCGKEAVKEAFHGVEMKSHATKDQKDKIGKLASQELNKKMGTSWKEASISWLENACRTLAPRFIHLYKRTIRERQARSDADADTNKSDSPAKKKAKLNNGRMRAVEESLAPVTPARKLSAMKKLSTDAPVPQSYEDQLLLCDRNIEVRIEPTAEAMEYDTVMISISAIVCDDVLTYQPEDIRTEHLSFNKFCNILASTSSDFDFRRNGSVLTHQPLQDLGTGPKEIHRELDFQLAVGVLTWKAQKEGSGKALVMQIRGTE